MEPRLPFIIFLSIAFFSFPYLRAELDLQNLFEWNGKRYLLSRNEADADTASTICQREGHKLLVISGNREDKIVKKYLTEQAHVAYDLWTSGKFNGSDAVWDTPFGKKGRRFIQLPDLELKSGSKCRRKDCDGDDCPPECGNAPKCNITMPPCETYTPPCEKLYPDCTAQRGNCSATCTPCEVLIPPQCSVKQGECKVITPDCEVEIPPVCHVIREPCYTNRPDNCTTVTKNCTTYEIEVPCASTPACHFIPKCETTEEECTTVPGACTTDHSKCKSITDDVTGEVRLDCGHETTTCAPPTTTCQPGKTTCKPPFHCDPIVCYKNSTVCENPVTHCESPVTICPDPIVICPHPDPVCPAPIVDCPDPEVICTQPLLNCTGPDIACPGVVTDCGELVPNCPKPIVDCPPPILNCTDPVPCPEFTPSPLTNPTCPPGYEECDDCDEPGHTTPMPDPETTSKKPGGGCIYLAWDDKYKWEVTSCEEKKRFICEAEVEKS